MLKTKSDQILICVGDCFSLLCGSAIGFIGFIRYYKQYRAYTTVVKIKWTVHSKYKRYEQSFKCSIRCRTFLLWLSFSSRFITAVKPAELSPVLSLKFEIGFELNCHWYWCWKNRCWRNCFRWEHWSSCPEKLFFIWTILGIDKVQHINHTKYWIWGLRIRRKVLPSFSPCNIPEVNISTFHTLSIAKVF